MSALTPTNLKLGIDPAPYTTQTVTVAGLRLSIKDFGSPGKPEMLCVHGGAANSHWFDFVATGFCNDFHVRAIDLRGHGDSQWDPAADPDYSYERYAADIHELTELLDIKDFVLVGHSMGGIVSSVYAGTYPGRANTFILVDSTLNLSPERIAGFNAVGSREGRHYATEAEFIANYKVRPGGSTATPAGPSHIAQHSGRLFEDGRWRYKFDRKVYANRKRVEIFPHWNHITIPALLVKGDRSGRITPETIAEVKARSPRVSVTEISNSEHHVTLDNPIEFVQTISEFIHKNKSL